MTILREIARTLKKYYLATLAREALGLSFGSIGNGCLESVQAEGAEFKYIGWYQGPQLDLVLYGIAHPLVRAITRPDAIQKLGSPFDEKFGFEVILPSSSTFSVRLADGDAQLDAAEFQLFQRVEKMHAVAKVAISLFKIAILNPVTLLRYIFKNDRAAAGRLEQLLLPKTDNMLPRNLDLSIFEGAKKTETVLPSDVAIVLPVYNSFELLKECLSRVVAHNDKKANLIVVEDCSSDDRVRSWLRDFAKQHSSFVTLLENENNLGFIGAVNKGLTYAKDKHVVLLNSDAFVPKNWLPRLLAPIIDNPNIASATPLSNNAEILSVPIICKENILAEGAIDRIDSVADALNGKAPIETIPTGIGFCMALNKSFLAKLPQLDRRFGKGYGEEVDWCQKAKAIGGHHVAVKNIFVQHVGGESFGSEKQARLAKNNAVISRLYPNYDQLVRDFSQGDTLQSTRIALGVAAIDIGRPVPIFFCHAIGGGTETYLQDRIQKELRKNQGCIVIRGNERTQSYLFELYAPAGTVSAQVAGFSQIATLLAPIRRCAFIYTCMVNFRAPLALMKNICALMVPGKDDLQIQIHDFFPICPSYNLLDHEGNFCNLPELETCSSCMKNQTAPIGKYDILQWRENWAEFLEVATSIETYSQSSKAIILKAYPKQARKVIVNPHALPVSPGTVSYTKKHRSVVGVLGNIGFNKGAGILREMATNVKFQPGQLVVFGELDPKFSHSKIRVTGKYSVENLARLAEKNKVACWLIPSIWPETFSYTTHEALSTGLPVFTFDLGGQAEAIKRAPNGHIIGSDPNFIMSDIDTILSQRENIAALVGS